jgi:hypothetical protein
MAVPTPGAVVQVTRLLTGLVQDALYSYTTPLWVLEYVAVTIFCVLLDGPRLEPASCTLSPPAVLHVLPQVTPIKPTCDTTGAM